MANKKIVEQKEAKVNELADQIKGASLVLVVDYRGTTVEEDTKLRKSLREANATSKVVKNNILKRALDKNGESELDDILVGPNALVFSSDEYLTPLKAVYKFSKEHSNYTIKGGFIEGKLMSVEEILTLAQLPSREELLSKLAGSLLQTIAKVAVALDQVRVKKEAEGAAPVAEAPAAAEEAKTEEVNA